MNILWVLKWVAIFTLAMLLPLYPTYLGVYIMKAWSETPESDSTIIAEIGVFISILSLFFLQVYTIGAILQ